MADKIDIEALIRAKRMLEENEPDGPFHFIATRRDLRALGYELADHVKPGDTFEWQGNKITVV